MGRRAAGRVSACYTPTGVDPVRDPHVRHRTAVQGLRHRGRMRVAGAPQRHRRRARDRPHPAGNRTCLPDPTASAAVLRGVARGQPANLCGHAHRALAGIDPHGHQRDGGEHQRHRLLHPPIAAVLRDPRHVVRDASAGAARVHAQRGVCRARAPPSSLASRRAGQRPRGGGLILTADHVAKAYGNGLGATLAIKDLSFEVRDREFFCIVGPSGCGKTTLLKCISGLLQVTSGEVLLDGRRVTAPPEQMAVVFQEYGRSLFPWMRVDQNVRFPLQLKRLPRDKVESLVSDALAAVGLSDFARHYPWQLSGGMQQRVAIARALAYEPEILVMDEPFASVYAQTRADLCDLLLLVWKRFHVTILFVTHDIDQAVYLGDRILVLTPRPTALEQMVAVAHPLHSSRTTPQHFH